MLHTVAWLIVFVVGVFNYDKFDELNSFFWDSWLLWFVFFAVGYYLIYPKRVKKKTRKIDYVPLPNYSVFLNLINLIFFILTIQQGLQGGYGNFLINLRLSFIFKTNHLIQPFFFLFTFIWPLFLYEGVVFKNKKNLVSLIMFLLIYTFASGGNFGILMTISALLLILNHRKKIKKKYVISIASVSVLGVILISAFRGHTEDSLSVYLYAPLIAYQSVESTYNEIWGHETMRFFYSTFNTLGISDIKPPEDFYEYIMTPIMVNVYTVMRPFYSDFGNIGIVFGGLSYGLFYGYCYKGYLKGSLLQSSLYFGFAFAVLCVPFADLLFLNLSLVFRTIVINTVIFIAINRNIRTIEE